MRRLINSILTIMGISTVVIFGLNLFDVFVDSVGSEAIASWMVFNILYALWVLVRSLIYTFKKHDNCSFNEYVFFCSRDVNSFGTFFTICTILMNSLSLVVWLISLMC